MHEPCASLEAEYGGQNIDSGGTKGDLMHRRVVVR